MLNYEREIVIKTLQIISLYCILSHNHKMQVQFLTSENNLLTPKIISINILKHS